MKHHIKIVPFENNLILYFVFRTSKVFFDCQVFWAKGKREDKENKKKVEGEGRGRHRKQWKRRKEEGRGGERREGKGRDTGTGKMVLFSLVYSCL